MFSNPRRHGFLADDSGQDILEYVLLTSFIGFAAVVGVSLLREGLNNSYSSWDAAGQSDALVEVPEPVVAP